MNKPGYTRTARCRSCDQYIVWLKTEAGANMPVDADSVEEGDKTFDAKSHVSHFSTCPDADKFRKRR